MAKAPAVTAAAPEAKTKKGDGPVAVAYLDGDKEVKRVPANPTVIVVKDTKGGSSKQYNLSDLSHPMILQLAASALSKKLDTSVRNAVKANGGNVVEIADQIFANIKEGKLYSRKEGSGAGAGRPFDFDLWVEIMRRTATAKKKEFGDKEAAAIKNKLASVTPKERRDITNKWTKDAIVARNLKKIQLERTDAKLKKEGVDSDYDALADF